VTEIEFVECEEFGALEISAKRLMIDGEITLDPRIVDRGYLNVSLVKGQVVFRADRYVGLIPINANIVLRVRSRAKIANLAQMIVKSGIAPNAIADFARGYLPRFVTGTDIEKIYYAPLIRGAEKILDLGMMKTYIEIENPPAWRGRLLVSDTIKRYRAHNIRYRGEFDYKTLSYSGPENIALKHGLKIVRSWLQANDMRNPAIVRVDRALAAMEAIPDVTANIASLIQQIGRSAGRLPSQYAYYRDPLWTTYLLLQKQLPEISADGFINLESLIVDISKVFEAFIRKVLEEKSSERGWQIVDGNLKPFSFFIDNGDYHVQPDIVIIKDGHPAALLDVKYKPAPKEADRYEVLSFMNAIGIAKGGFVLPQRDGVSSRFMGQTLGGRELSLLRFDLAADEMEKEATRLFDNVERLMSGEHAYG